MSAPTLQRLPIESARPMVVFALVRLAMASTGLALILVLGLPYGGGVAVVLAGVAIPWSLLNLWVARGAPERAMNPLIAAGDLAVLTAVETVAPELYGPLRFLALFLLAVHAHFQGERIGLVVGLFAVVALAVPAALTEGGPVAGDLLIFYEAAFGATALATTLLVGRFRTAESASRLRARELSRRALRSEHEIRRRLSESLHDGPVQELISVGMVLTAATRAAEQGDTARAAELVKDARAAVAHNVDDLRDEMLDLGPYAYEEFSFAAAVERCMPVWKRRYDLDATLETSAVELPSEIEGELFRITQEAVANAARHGMADRVAVRLSAGDGSIRLVVADNGRGLGSVDPLGASEPGHIGLASMRERTEMLNGELSIESTSDGTTVAVTAPIRASRDPWR